MTIVAAGTRVDAIEGPEEPLLVLAQQTEECRGRVKQALGALELGGTRNPRDEMKLQAALGTSSYEASEKGAALMKALEIAESLDDSKYQLRALSGLYFYHAGSSRYRAALQLAQRFHDLAARGTDLLDQLLGSG